jgi:hypothetical protein
VLDVARKNGRGYKADTVVERTPHRVAEVERNWRRKLYSYQLSYMSLSLKVVFGKSAPTQSSRSTQQGVSMRRSLFAGIGVAAVLFLAACSPDQTRREPLAPADVGLAKGGGGGGGGSMQCSGGLASQIAKQEDNNFSPAQADELSALFTPIKSQCSTNTTTPSAAVLAYLQRVADFRGEPDEERADSLLALWKSVTEYATGTPIDRPPVVFITGHPPTDPPNNTDAERGGGAAVLDPTPPPPATPKLTMTTWDGQAGVKISSDQTPTGPHLITLYPAPCPGTTLLLATDDCYNVQSYPPVEEWDPLVEIGMCIHGGGAGPNTAISHFDAGYGTEVLPDGGGFDWSTIGCYANNHALIDTWLGRKAGPLGRALAIGLDYLRPRPLYADDAGESGLGLFFSPFGGVKTKIFEETFDAPGNAIGPFPQDPSEVAPDVGDSWDVFAPAPGYVQIVDGNVLAPNGGLPGQVIAISQAQGACTKKCPVFRLLGTRVNPTPAEEIGTYEVTWKSLQNKPNIKEAPFVLLSASDAEIARLSYVSQSNQNRILYNGVNTGILWTQNVAQSFKIVVRLNDDDASANDYTTDVYIDDMTTPVFTNRAFRSATQKTFATLGYKLDGIDAGIMAADNILVRRLPDKP